MISDVKEITLKPMKYSIFGLTHKLDMTDVAFQAIYKGIALVIPMHDCVKRVGYVMSGYGPLWLILVQY